MNQKADETFHYVIERDENDNGEATIYQLLHDEDRAQHAGKRGDGTYSNLNPRSIGIELVNLGWLQKDDTTNQYYFGDNISYNNRSVPIFTGLIAPLNSGLNLHDYWEPFTEAQYKSLKRLVDSLSTKYNISNIVINDGAYEYELDSAALSSFEGLLGHQVVSKEKYDPGPVFCWSRILAGTSCSY
jgi:N-acetyl-anhydromuramyl-L-alanine amidase AmpD